MDETNVTERQSIVVHTPSVECGISLMEVGEGDESAMQELFSEFDTDEDSPNFANWINYVQFRVSRDFNPFYWIARLDNEERTPVGMFLMITLDTAPSARLSFWFLADYWRYDIIAACLRTLSTHVAGRPYCMKSIMVVVPAWDCGLHDLLELEGYVRIEHNERDSLTFCKILDLSGASIANDLDSFCGTSIDTRRLRAIIPAQWFSTNRNGFIMDGDSMLLHLMSLKRATRSRSSNETKQADNSAADAGTKALDTEVEIVAYMAAVDLTEGPAVSVSTAAAEGVSAEHVQQEGEQEEESVGFIIDKSYGRPSAHVVMSVRKYLQTFAVDGVPIDVVFLESQKPLLSDSTYLFYRALVIQDLSQSCFENLIRCHELPSWNCLQFVDFLQFRDTPSRLAEVYAVDLSLVNMRDFSNILTDELGISVVHLPSLRGIHKAALVRNAENGTLDSYRKGLDNDIRYYPPIHTDELLETVKLTIHISDTAISKFMLELKNKQADDREHSVQEVPSGVDNELSPAQRIFEARPSYFLQKKLFKIIQFMLSLGSLRHTQQKQATDDPKATPEYSRQNIAHTVRSETQCDLESLLAVPINILQDSSIGDVIRELARSHMLSLCLQVQLPLTSRCFLKVPGGSFLRSAICYYQNLLCARVLHEAPERQRQLLSIDAWDGRLLGKDRQHIYTHSLIS